MQSFDLPMNYHPQNQYPVQFPLDGLGTPQDVSWKPAIGAVFGAATGIILSWVVLDIIGIRWGLLVSSVGAAGAVVGWNYAKQAPVE